MSNVVKLKRSNVADKVPIVSDLVAGELAVNTATPAIYFGTGSDIVQIATTHEFSLTTTTTASNQVLDTFLVASFRSAQYSIQLASGTSYQMLNINVLHDDSAPYILPYGSITTGSALATFDVSIAAGVLSLTLTPTNAATVIKGLRSTIRV